MLFCSLHPHLRVSSYTMVYAIGMPEGRLGHTECHYGRNSQQRLIILNFAANKSQKRHIYIYTQTGHILAFIVQRMRPVC